MTDATTTEATFADPIARVEAGDREAIDALLGNFAERTGMRKPTVRRVLGALYERMEERQWR